MRYRSQISLWVTYVTENITGFVFGCVQLVKQCNAMLEAGRAYCQSSKSFVSGLRELGIHFSGDATMGVSDLNTYSAKLGQNVHAWKKKMSASFQLKVTTFYQISLNWGFAAFFFLFLFFSFLHGMRNQFSVWPLTHSTATPDIMEMLV